MRGSGFVWEALASARRLNLGDAGAPAPEAGTPGATRRAVLKALGAGGLAAALAEYAADLERQVAAKDAALQERITR